MSATLWKALCSNIVPNFHPHPHSQKAFLWCTQLWMALGRSSNGSHPFPYKVCLGQCTDTHTLTHRVSRERNEYKQQALLKILHFIHVLSNQVQFSKPVIQKFPHDEHKWPLLPMSPDLLRIVPIPSKLDYSRSHVMVFSHYLILPPRENLGPGVNQPRGDRMRC